MITIKTKDGRLIDLADSQIHKYGNPQGIWNSCVFIIESEFKKNFKGFAILTHKGWYYFDRETVEKYGLKCHKPGKFNDEHFIRISIFNADGHE